jgi:microcompartment protein CcmL/EutN
MRDREYQQYALGMIETKGLIGAIEAADAACKAAQVKLVSKERVGGALVNIKVVGEVAAVRSAIEAGAAAAQKVGGLVAFHIIPNPVEGLEPYIFNLPSNNGLAIEPEQGEISELQDEKPNIEPGKEDEEIVPDDSVEANEQEQISMVYSEFEGSDDELLTQLEGMTVPELRRMARGVEGLSIFGREISKANKEKLISEIMKAHHKK